MYYFFFIFNVSFTLLRSLLLLAAWLCLWLRLLESEQAVVGGERG
jgi:hypothetical protein